MVFVQSAHYSLEKLASVQDAFLAAAPHEGYALLAPELRTPVANRPDIVDVGQKSEQRDETDELFVLSVSEETLDDETVLWLELHALGSVIYQDDVFEMPPELAEVFDMHLFVLGAVLPVQPALD